MVVVVLLVLFPPWTRSPHSLYLRWVGLDRYVSREQPVYDTYWADTGKQLTNDEWADQIYSEEAGGRDAENAEGVRRRVVEVQAGTQATGFYLWPDHPTLAALLFTALALTVAAVLVLKERRV